MTHAHDETPLPEVTQPLDGSKLPPLVLDDTPTVWQRPQTAKRILRVLGFLCLVLLAFEFFPYAHPHGIEKDYAWFGFYAFYGLVAVIVLAVVGMAVGQSIFKRGDA